MASKAAAAMYPNLAQAERDEPRLRDKSDSKGSWGKSDHPVWSGYIRPSPNPLDRIPGLKRVTRT